METHHFWIDDESPDIGIDQLLLASRQWSSRIESYPTSADFQMRSTQRQRKDTGKT